MGAHLARREASLRRIVVEAGREARRGSILRLAAAYVVVSTVLAMFFGGGRYFEWYLRTVYLFVPLLMVLLGARCVVRDHRRGFSFVVATTPLTHVEAAFAKVFFLGGFLATCLALTLPVTLVLTAVVKGTDPGDASLQVHVASGLRALLYAGSGFLVGLFSGVVGLVVGHAVNRRHRSPWTPYAVAVGGVLWFGLAALAAFLALRPDRASTPVQGLLQLSPVSMAFDALDLVPETRVLSAGVSGAFDVWMRRALVAGLLLVVFASLVALSRREGRRAPTVCVLVALLGASLVALPVGMTARYGVVDVGGATGLLPIHNASGLVVRSVLAVADEAASAVDNLTLQGSGVAKVTLHLKAKEPSRYVLDRVCLVAPGIRFDALESPTGPGCQEVGREIAFQREGEEKRQEFAFDSRVVAPDGDLTSVRVDVKLRRVDVLDLPALELSLGNALGVAGGEKALAKPARLALVSIVGMAQLFAMGLLYVGLDQARKARVRRWEKLLGGRR